MPELLQTRQLAEKTTTRAQIQLFNFDQRKENADQSKFQKYRKMRDDSTIGLSREVVVGQTMQDQWVVSGDGEEEREYIRKYMLPLRDVILETSLFAQIDFGWKAFEVVLQVVEDDSLGVRIVPGLLKPLLNDVTLARYDIDSGRFVGLWNKDLEDGSEYEIDVEHSLFVNFDDEGVGKYGRPLMKRAEIPYDCWHNANDTADRYDRKVAGAALHIDHPLGKTPVNGVETDNADIAKKIAQTVEASGTLITFHKAEDDMERDSGDRDEWKVSYVSPQAGGQAEFVDRMKYLDSLKTRAMGTPERAILEGQFGTKAESTAQAGMMKLISRIRHARILADINEQLTHPMLQLNFGQDRAREASVSLPDLSEEDKERFSDIYGRALSDTAILEEEIENVLDMEQIRECLNLPTIPIEDREEREKMRGLLTVPRGDQNDEDMEDEVNDAG